MVNRESLLSLAKFSGRKIAAAGRIREKRGTDRKKCYRIPDFLITWLLDERAARIDNRHIAAAIPTG